MGNLQHKYDDTHQHPVNQRLHAIGIPLIAVSALAALSPWRPLGWPRSMFLAGVITFLDDQFQTVRKRPSMLGEDASYRSHHAAPHARLDPSLAGD